jgi:hypothetical protein
MKTKLVFNSPDSQDGERRLKQHIFQSKMINPLYYDVYEGNISLCSRISIGDENCKLLRINKIESEELDEEKCCKHCLKEYKKLLNTL